MLDLLQYPFFQLALLGVTIISIAAAIIGTYIITRRMVAIAGGVTHACFGGLGLGYFLGVNPIAMAALFAVGSSLTVQWMSNRMRVRQDSAIAVIWAVGMAIGVLFVFLTPGYVPELNSFLFGNILTVTTGDIIIFTTYTIALISLFVFKFRTIVTCAFDRDFARVTGLPVNTIELIMTVMIALCIVLTIRLVGIMLLMSMMSLPMIIAETFSHNLKTMMITSAIISLVSSIAGLFIGAIIDVPCSALIVIILATTFILSRLTHLILSK
ncbi:MAG: metal ABC transporter permease [Muribaculaceae bacterium]|nr:metal ABC transporter permease [Muribaculaceae bacterium]